MAVSCAIMKKLLGIKENDKEGKIACLKNLIVFSENDVELVFSDEDLASANKTGVKVLSYNFLLKESKLIKAFDNAEPSIDSLCVLAYTSGTTGNPKAVKVTHRMMVVNISDFRMQTKFMKYNMTDRILQYGPLAHSSGLMVINFNISFGSCIGFSSGDPTKFVEDCNVLKPTLMLILPKMTNLFFAKINQGLSILTGCKRKLVETAINSKVRAIERGEGFTHCFYDRIVMKKFKNLLGGCVRGMHTGAAPTDPKVLDFMQACFCAPIIEGYAMTETMGSGVM
jgi:long-chain acyl-CoA synthetase